MQLFTSYHLLNDYFTDNPTHRSTRSARAGTDGDRNARPAKHRSDGEILFLSAAAKKDCSARPCRFGQE